VNVRELLLKYKIKPTGLVGMARQARQAISSTETRADLLELLLELQEFGAAAKQRGVIGEAAMTDAGERSSSASAVTARRHGLAGSSDKTAEGSVDRIAPPPADDMRKENDPTINQVFSDSFFKSLNHRDGE
jgi:hypothetical protein